ncbi:MAG: TetR family transcriptional regulator [Steroidobacteraceae bacterium]
MPKVVDHEQRREEIAHVACQVIARHGFDQATVARIARAAGFTTGMVAHYFENKQQIVIAALRLVLRRMEQRLTRSSRGETSLFKVLTEALAIDAQRYAECAFWTAFWGQVAVDPAFKRINAGVHREYRLACTSAASSSAGRSGRSSGRARAAALGSITIFINGLTASVVTSHGATTGPRSGCSEQLRLQLELLERRAASLGTEQEPPWTFPSPKNSSSSWTPRVRS